MFSLNIPPNKDINVFAWTNLLVGFNNIVMVRVWRVWKHHFPSLTDKLSVAVGCLLFSAWCSKKGGPAQGRSHFHSNKSNKVYIRLHMTFWLYFANKLRNQPWHHNFVVFNIFPSYFWQACWHNQGFGAPGGQFALLDVGTVSISLVWRTAKAKNSRCSVFFFTLHKNLNV